MTYTHNTRVQVSQGEGAREQEIIMPVYRNKDFTFAYQNNKNL